jgi:hypothetical protein
MEERRKERENSLYLSSHLLYFYVRLLEVTQVFLRTSEFSGSKGMRNKAQGEVVNKVSRYWFRKGNLFQIEFVV